jgi:hypothetical protein
MWNSGKSTDRALHPEMRSYRIEGSRLWSFEPLQHGTMAQGAVASKVTDSWTSYGQGVHEARAYRDI